jgi:hypothetical protein
MPSRPRNDFNRSVCRLGLRSAAGKQPAKRRPAGEQRPFQTDSAHARVVERDRRVIEPGACIGKVSHLAVVLKLLRQPARFGCQCTRLPPASRVGSDKRDQDGSNDARIGPVSSVADAPSTVTVITTTVPPATATDSPVETVVITSAP